MPTDERRIHKGGNKCQIVVCVCSHGSAMAVHCECTVNLRSLHGCGLPGGGGEAGQGGEARRGKLGDDVEADGAGHDDVVVVALGGRVASVGSLLKHSHFFNGVFVALYIEAVSYRGDEIGHGGLFGAPVGVKTGPGVESGVEFVDGGAHIEVGISLTQLAENVERGIAVAAAFERVALDYQQGVGVVSGYGGGFPAYDVMIGMTAPLGHHFGKRPARGIAIKDTYHAPVALEATAADVDAHHIAVAPRRGLAPQFEAPCRVGFKLHIAQGVGSGERFSLHFACE